MPAEFIELSPAKLNLFLKIINKRNNGYHNLRSGVTLINIYDEVIAKKDSKFSVKYIGEFSPINNKFKDCIVDKIFLKLDLPKPNYCFTIKKNIPIMSGLGSASSNAAAVIRILEKLNYKDLKMKNFECLILNYKIYHNYKIPNLLIPFYLKKNYHLNQYLKFYLFYYIYL